VVVELVWYGHDAFHVAGPPVVYIDPWRLPEDLPLADVVLITHDHYDHCSPEDVDKILGPDTLIVGPSAALRKLAGTRAGQRPVRVGDQLTVGNMQVQIVPAYNTNKRFHPRTAGYVGYVLELNGIRIYHAGDTDLIPEMESVRCDVALLPVSGTYVMDAEEAAQAAAVLQPRLAIPMHYGVIVGSEKDAERFRHLAPVPVRILETEELLALPAAFDA